MTTKAVCQNNNWPTNYKPNHSTKSNKYI